MNLAKIFSTFLMIAFFVSCSDPQKELENKITATLNSHLGTDVKVISIDTITQRKEYDFPIQSAKDSFIKYGDMLNHNLKLRTELVRENSGRNSSLEEMFQKRRITDSLGILYQVDNAIYDHYSKLSDDLKIAQKNADDKILRYYGARAVVGKDTIYYPITPDLKVKTVAEINKEYNNSFQ